MLSRTDQTELLEPLHAGVHETPRWATFLARLRQRMRADAAVLVAGGHVLHSGLDLDQLREKADLPSFGAPAYAALRPGRIYAGEELVDPVRAAARRRPPAFARVLRAAGAEAQGLLVGLRTERDFAAADASVLAGLSAHLAIALDTRARLARAETSAALSADALAAARTAWLGFDAEARLVAASPACPPLLADAGIVAVSGRRLAGLSGEAEASLASACAAFGVVDGAPIRLTTRAPMDMLVVPAAQPSGAAVAVGLLRLPPSPSPARHRLLMRLHGLTETEARLAEAIVGGASLDEGARICRLSRESARTYSKRIFAKTRTRGQPDLVRLLLTGLGGLDTSPPPA
ncbi:helix-turn-helix transcriptional regulator [Sphingomonas sp.]|uniref:helix-turn-helix transcriptional regulator n=1 Tax=Sphingomonas sp. TaxID=28214 RepID=UPI0035C81786